MKSLPPLRVCLSLLGQFTKYSTTSSKRHRSRERWFVKHGSLSPNQCRRGSIQIQKVVRPGGFEPSTPGSEDQCLFKENVIFRICMRPILPHDHCFANHRLRLLRRLAVRLIHTRSISGGEVLPPWKHQQTSMCFELHSQSTRSIAPKWASAVMNPTSARCRIT